MIEGKHIHKQAREIVSSPQGLIDTVTLDISAATRGSFFNIVIDINGPFSVRHAQEISDAIHAVLEGK